MTDIVWLTSKPHTMHGSSRSQVAFTAASIPSISLNWLAKCCMRMGKSEGEAEAKPKWNMRAYKQWAGGEGGSQGEGCQMCLLIAM